MSSTTEKLEQQQKVIDRLKKEIESKEDEIAKLSSPERNRLHNPDGLTYNRPEHGWVCFHCGDTLMTFGEAEAHFGETPEVGIPRCKELLEENKKLKKQLENLGE